MEAKSKQTKQVYRPPKPDVFLQCLHSVEKQPNGYIITPRAGTLRWSDEIIMREFNLIVMTLFTLNYVSEIIQGTQFYTHLLIYCHLKTNV